MDASWKSDGKATLGWVLLLDQNTVQFEGMERFYAQTPLQAETMAIYEVLRWAMDMGILHCWIQSDCL